MPYNLTTHASDEDIPSTHLTTEEKNKLYEELAQFRLSLPGHGRTSVGSTSLSSGVTTELIEHTHFLQQGTLRNVFPFSATIMLLAYGILLKSM